MGIPKDEIIIGIVNNILNTSDSSQVFFCIPTFPQYKITIFSRGKKIIQDVFYQQYIVS